MENNENEVVDQPVKRKRRLEKIENYRVIVKNDPESILSFEDIFYSEEFKEIVRRIILS